MLPSHDLVYAVRARMTASHMSLAHATLTGLFLCPQASLGTSLIRAAVVLEGSICAAKVLLVRVKQ